MKNSTQLTTKLLRILLTVGIIVTIVNISSAIQVYGLSPWIHEITDIRPELPEISNRVQQPTIRGDVLVPGAPTSQPRTQDTVTPRGITPFSLTHPIQFHYHGGGHTSGQVPAPHGIFTPGTIIIAQPGNMARTGHQFVGWRNGSAIFQPGQSFNYNAGHTGHFHFEAVWAPNVNLTFNANNSMASPATQTVTRGAGFPMRVMPVQPMRVATTFIGWYNTSAPTGGTRFTADSIVPNSATTYWARWEIILSFEGSGGAPALQQVRRTLGSQMGALPTQPTRQGFTFAGWLLPSGERLTSNTIINFGNAPVLAQWTPNNVNLTFNANGGSPNTTLSRQVGSQIGTLPTPTRTGAVFVGWYNTSAPTGGTRLTNTSVVPTSNTTYWARWSVTINFLSNGGLPAGWTWSGRVIGSQIDSMPNQPTRAGFIFDGWQDSNNRRITFPLTVPSTNTSYRAIWLPVITVRFDNIVNVNTVAARNHADASVSNEIRQLFLTNFGVNLVPVAGGARFEPWLNSLPVIPGAISTREAWRVVDVAPSNADTIRLRFVDYTMFSSGRPIRGIAIPRRVTIQNILLLL